MKNIYRILAFTAFVAAFASCREVSDYQTTPFVNLYRTTVSVSEDVGTVILPVKLGTLKGDKNTSVTFKVVEGTAKEGVNFTVEPAGKVLSFNGTDSLAIKINVVDQPGVFTGALDFQIELESATNDYQVGGSNVTSFTIKDNDHPLANLFGTFSGPAPGYWGDNYTAEVQILAHPDDVNKVLVYNLDPYLASYGYTAANKYNIFTGTVNAEKTKITIETDQETGYVSSSQGPLCEVGFDAPNIDDASGFTDIVFEFSSDYKTITVPNGYACRTSAGWWEIYVGPMTWTRK